MALIIGGKEINIPVLPPKISVSSPGKNEKLEVLGLGEILRLKGMGLRSISWESFFPYYQAPYTTGEVKNPISIVKQIRAARDKKEPVRLLIIGTDLDFNSLVGIESFDYEERSGELNDIYYSIKLSEWKSYEPQKIVLTPKKQKKEVVIKPKPRPGKPPKKSKTYTVIAGDCLWAIAQRYYGDGGEYMKIYNANKGVIGADPSLIYPGQVLVIP